MPNPHNLAVGQELFVKVINYYNKDADVYKAVIIKLGRKYFTVELQNPYKTQVIFLVETLRQHVEFRPRYFIYFSEQQILDEKEYNTLARDISRIMREMDSFNKPFTLQELRNIMAVLKECEYYGKLEK